MKKLICLLVLCAATGCKTKPKCNCDRVYIPAQNPPIPVPVQPPY